MQPHDDRDRQTVLKHLDCLLATPAFNGAALQQKALRFIVEASLDGKTLTARDLASQVYGRSDDDYVKAVRALSREVRLKLPGIYAKQNDNDISIVVDPGSYNARFVRQRSKPVSREPARGFWTRTRVAVAAISVVGGLLGLLALGRGLPISPAAHSITQNREAIQVLDVRGRSIDEWQPILEDLAGFRLGQGDVSSTRDWIRALAVQPQNVFAVACKQESLEACKAVLFDGKERRPLKEVSLPYFSDLQAPAELTELSGPEQRVDNTHPAFYKISDVAALDADGDGRRDEIAVAVTHFKQFPTQIAVIDFDHVEPVRVAYWTMGVTKIAIIPSLQEGTGSHVVAYGTNNAFDTAAFSVLPPLPEGETYVAKTPDAPPRHKLISEFLSYPSAGLTVRLPSSVLAQDRFLETSRRPSSVNRLAWDEEDQKLTIDTYDGAQDIDSKERLRLQFVIDLGDLEVVSRLASEDGHRRSMKKLILQWRLNDDWGVLEDDFVAAYGQQLADGIRMWVSKDEDWTEFRPDRLARELGVQRP